MLGCERSVGNNGPEQTRGTVSVQETKSMFDELHDDIWHLMLHMYVYQEKIKEIVHSETRYEFANEIVSITALAENITLRVARLADRTKGTRSLRKFQEQNKSLDKRAQELFEKFEELAKPVLETRHTQIAHVRPGTLGSYPLEPLPRCVIRAVEQAIRFIDHVSGQECSYSLYVGSQEAKVDLRASISVGRRIYVDQALDGRL
jgi:hypothetical protein